jgi:hypothetical protein
MRATVTGSSGAGPIEQSYGWDENSASTWFRQQSDGLTFEFLRVTVQDRVVEEYAFNDRFLRLEYADLPVAIASKTIEKYLRGESLEGASADVVELAGELEEFEAFAAQLPSAPAASEDSALLTSLLGDPVFADAIVGEDVTPNRPDGLCKSFNLCVAFACRIIVNQYICGVCVAGSLACAFMDWFCYMWCGGGN